MDIALPRVKIPREEQDPHSKRLLKVCDLWDQDFTDEQIKRARRAYYGAVSYVDDCVGKLLDVLKRCRLDDDTIVIFSGDHGDMLGERGLWYKMSYFESSARVPLLIRHPSSSSSRVKPGRRVSQNVSTLDIMPTMCDLVGTKPLPGLELDGKSLLPHLLGNTAEAHDEALAEYTGEGTISPLVMIRRGPWKYVACPADGRPQLFNLVDDPLELVDLVKVLDKKAALRESGEAAEVTAPAEDRCEAARAALDAFEKEAAERWDYAAITQEVLLSQRKRRLVWAALKKGRFTSWDYDPVDDGREKYIRSHMHLDDLERMARYPPVDAFGRETVGVVVDQAGSHGQ